MTVDELIVEVYENLGEPTYLSPYNGSGVLDASVAGYQTILRWVNQAIRAIATWKDRVSGRQFRYVPFLKEKFGKPVSGVFQVTSVSTPTVLVTDCTWGNPVGVTLRVGEESRVVVQGGAGVLEVGKPLSVTPSVGVEVTLRYPFVDVAEEGIIDTVQVRDEMTGVTLEKAPKGEVYLDTRHVWATPTSWYRAGMGIVGLNTTPSDERWYRVVAYQVPSVQGGGTGGSPLPPQFDGAIVLYATGLGFLRMQEMTAKYSVLQDFEAFMRSTQSQEDVQGRMENGILWIVGEE